MMHNDILINKNIGKWEDLLGDKFLSYLYN